MARRRFAVTADLAMKTEKQYLESKSVFKGISIGGNARVHIGPYTNYNYGQSLDDEEYDKAELNRALNDLSTLTVDDALRKIHQHKLRGTGQGFLDSHQYQQWRDSTFEAYGEVSDHLLWCYGSPGCGKTFLAATIIGDLTLRSLDVKPGFHTSVLHLFLSRQRRFEQSTSSLLASLARQSCEQIPDRPWVRARDILDDHLRKQDCRSVSALQNLLELCNNSFTCTYIVVDGLDEFSADPDERAMLVESLRSVQGKGRWYGQVRLCILTREAPSARTRFRHAWIVELHADQKDITDYIDRRIEHSSALSEWTQADGTLKTDIVTQVVRGSKLLFKLASLHMDHICKQRTLLAVKQAVSHLPARMDDYYSQTLQAALFDHDDDDDRDFVKRLLGWMLQSKCPFQTKQLRQAFAMTSGVAYNVLLKDLDADIATIAGRCEGLIQGGGNLESQLTFSHSTVHSFLSGKAHLFDDTDWKRDITSVCLRFMALDACLEALLRTYKTHPPTERQAPTSIAFLDWAAYNWHSTMRSACAGVSPINELEENVRSGFLAWDEETWTSALANGRLDGLQHALLKFSQRLWTFSRSNGVSPVAICCYFEWPATAALFMSATGVEINERGAWEEAPLHLAIGRRNLKLVDLLLAHRDVDVNLPYVYKRTPLHMAVALSFPEALQALVSSWRLHVKATDVLGWTPFRLLWKTYTSHTVDGVDVSRELMEIMLRHPDVDVNESSDDRTRGPQDALEEAIRIYNADCCSCASRSSRHRQQQPTCSSCALLRILLEQPGLVIPPATIHVAILRGEHPLVNMLLAHQNVDINMELLPGIPAAIMAVHLMHLNWSRVSSLVAEHGSEDTDVVRILRPFMRRADFDINRVDLNDHTVLDWLDFYEAMPSDTLAYFKRDSAQGSPDYVIDFRRRSVQIDETVSDIIAGRARWRKDDHKILELALEHAGAQRNHKVEPTTFAGLVTDLKRATHPRSSDTPAASMFPSLAVERGSRVVLSVRTFDSLVGTKPV